ncbi:hypothetical protein HZB90_04305 [archaeon]|nr:hypothetical protein [archaeon]
MSKEEYVAMLNRLPIDSPTDKHVKALLPYLSANEVSEVLFFDRGQISKQIAAPPLRVDGAYHLLSVACHGGVHERINWYDVLRTKCSYADPAGRRYIEGSRPYHERAMEFARKNWGDDLTLDDWVDFVELRFVNPFGIEPLNPGDQSVFFTATGNFEEIMQDTSFPLSTLLNDYVCEVTTDRILATELRGDRKEKVFYNCASDGGAIVYVPERSRLECSECNGRFDGKGIVGSPSSLPEKVSELLLAQGYRFRRNPGLARNREARAFNGAKTKLTTKR